jgi:hypothetical protein
MYLDLKCSIAKEISGHTGVDTIGWVPHYLRASQVIDNDEWGFVVGTIRCSMKPASQQMLGSLTPANTNSGKLKLYGAQNDEGILKCGDGGRELGLVNGWVAK